MAAKWTKRFVLAALVAGGAYAGAVHFNVLPPVGNASARQGGAGEARPIIAEAGTRALELSPVEIVTVELAYMVERLRVSGELRPVNRVVLKAKVGGTVNDVALREGQAVKAGDVLVRFDTEDLKSSLNERQANLEAAEAHLEHARQTLTRTETLFKKGSSTRVALEKAQNDAATSQASVRALSSQVETARTALRDAEVVAPFDGIVASRAVEPGAPASANAELLTIVDTSILEAEVLVSTRDITRLAIGQTAELQIDGLEGQTVTGTVNRINPVANEGSRFVPVHIRLENPDGRLWGGMFATGSVLVRESRDAFFLPTTSLREDAEGVFVLKLEDGHLQRQAIVPAAFWNSGNMVEIADGIEQGDVVVVAPLPELEPEMPAAVAGKAG